MSESSFRRVARTGLAPLLEDVSEGPEWTDLTPETTLAPSRSTRFGWLAGAGAAAAVLVVVGATAFLTGDEPVPPPATDANPPGDWDVVDFPQGFSSINALMVWTGDEMVFWGGQAAEVEETPTGEPGMAYNPETREWRSLPSSPKRPSIGAAGVWTGDELIICCGIGNQFADFPATVAYNPATNSWRRLADAPISGSYTEVVWTGEEMLVVALGGVAGYDPDTDSWTSYPSPADGGFRLGEIAWTGEELIIWSREVEREVHPGISLSPATGAWRTLPEPPAWPAAPDIVWTGEHLVIWGGLPAAGGGSERAVGSVYDPDSDSWTEMAEALPEPEAFEGNLGSQSMVWTGETVLVSTGAFGSGADPETSLLLTYDPPTDTWELVDQALLPVSFWAADVSVAGDRIVIRSDRLYISPAGWVPQGERITADSWATTTTTSVPTTTVDEFEGQLFIPNVSSTGSGLSSLNVAFLDGTTANLSWPEGLDLLSEGVTTHGWGALNSLGSGTSRTMLAIPDTADSAVERFGVGELLTTYPDGREGTVEFRRFPVDATVDYLVFDMGAWTVLVYDYQSGPDGRMRESSRETWARSLSGETSPEGFLSLSAEVPLVLAGPGASPPVSLGFQSQNGTVGITLFSCSPNETIEDEAQSITWCDRSGKMFITVHSTDGDFRNAVRDSLSISEISESPSGTPGDPADTTTTTP